MASYKDILRLIREGKTPAEIRAAVPAKRKELRRLLGSVRLADELEMDRQFAGRLGRHRLAVAMHHLIERRLELVDNEDAETSRKAAENLTEQYTAPVKGLTAKDARKELELQQKIDFLKQLLGTGSIDPNVLLKNRETGRYGFEEVIERKNLRP
jgi:hypothetical protein